MALPANMGFGTVTGTFMKAAPDGPDADKLPDGVPLQGLQIVFTPAVGYVRNVTATPRKLIIPIDPVECSTDSEGRLIDPQGSPDVVLVAGNDPEITPTNWTWNVSIPSLGININILVEDGQTVDLASVVPVPASPGTDIANWNAAVIAAQNLQNELVVSVDPQSDWTGNVTLASGQTRGTYLRRRLTGNTTLSVLSGVANQAYSCTLELQQDATGNRTIVLANVATPYGLPLVLSTAANSVDKIRLEWTGTRWEAYLAASSLMIPSSWTV